MPDEVQSSEESLAAAEERLQITSEALAAAEGEIKQRTGSMTPEEVDEAVLVMGELRRDYRFAEREVIRIRRELEE